MPIDTHAHYVPPQLLSAIVSKGGDIGVSLETSASTPAIHFNYGFKARPFFPKLIEPVAKRIVWMDEQGIDVQIVGTWPDIFGYGLAIDECIVWHQMLNDTLAAWCDENRAALHGSAPYRWSGQRRPRKNWHAR